jgi:hypothetical protein
MSSRNLTDTAISPQWGGGDSTERLRLWLWWIDRTKVSSSVTRLTTKRGDGPRTQNLARPEAGLRSVDLPGTKVLLMRTLRI